MSNKNTRSLICFIFENCYYALLGFVLFCILLMHKPVSLSVPSALYLLCFVFLSVAGGIWLTHKKRRNGLSIIVNVLFPFEVYTLFKFGKELISTVLILLVPALLLSAGYLFLLLKRPKQSDRKAIPSKRVYYGGMGIRTIAVLVMVPTVVLFGVNLIFNPSLFAAAKEPSSGRADSVYGDTDIEEDAFLGGETSNEIHTIGGHIETIGNLRQEVWVTLTNDEKIDTLQTVADIEAYSLGLPYELTVRLESLKENTLGQYNRIEQSIEINIDYFDRTAFDILGVVCHEAYHAYQTALVNAYESIAPEYRDLSIFRDAREFQIEFENYVIDDYDVYYAQACESTARDYSTIRVQEYYYRLDCYFSADTQF